MTRTEDRLIVALDVDDPYRAIDLIARLRNVGINFFKVSASNLMQPDADALFRYVAGSESALPRLMLDLKVWDTPDSVERIVRRAIERYDPAFVTVHPSRSVVEAALRAAADYRTTILPVAYLSSDEDPDTILPGYDAIGRAGAAVCPARGVAEYRSVFHDAVLVCPGVRLADEPADDHSGASPPREALASGATYLVVGRPIVAADDPVAAALRYLEATS